MYGFFPNFATSNATLNATSSSLCQPLEVSPHHVTAGALKAHQQSMVWLGAAMAGFQVVLHLRQQMRRHLSIGQGPVRTA
jgi:hypothetical protein